jgi:DNA-binding CsgD family transcriptional regulator
MLNWRDRRAAKLIGHDPVPFSAILHVADVFGLSQSEARVVALLSDGYTLIESSEIMCCTEASARTYLKRVFAKTYTHTQAQLVRVVYRATLDIAA